MVAAVYVLRRRLPDLYRPYKTWGYPLTPALLLIAYAAVFVSKFISDWRLTAAVLTLIALGVVYYFIWHLGDRRQVGQQPAQPAGPR